MFGRKHPARHDATDESLQKLMRQWRGVEPHAGFEAAVWRRIRLEAVPHPAGMLDRLWDWLLPHPVLAGAAVMAVALLTGALVAQVAPGYAQTGHAEEHPLLRSGTVAGTYLAMSAGRHP